MLGVRPSQGVARILEDGVLKSATRPEEWETGFTRVSNRQQCALHAAVGTRRYAPQPIARREALNSSNLLCRNPFPLELRHGRIGGQPQGHRYGLMCEDGCIVVANEADENLSLHVASGRCRPHDMRD